MEDRLSIRYSEAFKIRVIQELDQGIYCSIDEARERYGIHGGSTIQTWLKKYGRNDILAKRVRIEMPDEQNELKKMKKRIRELEKALADTTVDKVLYQAHFEVVCEQMGLDIEETKKKIDKQLYKESKK